MGRCQGPAQSGEARHRLRGGAEALRIREDFLEIFDSAHSDLEDRFIAIGPIEGGLAVVVYTEREEDTVRIIGARWANPPERSLYRSYMDQRT